MNIYTVYKVTNVINSKEYIGIHATENPYDDYLGSGVRIKLALKKYGKENFKKEILFVFDNPEDMIAKEAELVNEEYVKRDDTYNLVSGGIYRDYTSEETINKIRLAATLQFSDPENRRKMSEIAKSRMTEDMKNIISNTLKIHYKNNPQAVKDISDRAKNRSDESLARLSTSLKEYYKSNPGKIKEMSDRNRILTKELWKNEDYRRKVIENLPDISGKNNPMWGKTLSPEHRQKISEANMCKIFDDEYRRKISEGRRGVIMASIKCPHCDKVGKLNLMKRWHFDNCKFKDVLNNTMISDSDIGKCDLSLNTKQT